MSTIGITVPVGSPTALALAVKFLRDVQNANALIIEEIGASVDCVVHQATGGEMAPAPQSGASPDAGGGVELDKRGLPWDARINSDAKERLNTKGEWKRRKNISDELVAQVESELRAGLAVGTVAAPTPPTPPAPPSPPAAPEPIKVLQAVGAIDLDAYRKAGWNDEQLVANGHAQWVEQAPAAPTPPAPPAPPAAAAAPASDDPTDWNGVANWVTKLQAGGVSLSPPELNAAARTLGLQMLPELSTRPELIPQFVAEIKRVKGL